MPRPKNKRVSPDRLDEASEPPSKRLELSTQPSSSRNSEEKSTLEALKALPHQELAMVANGLVLELKSWNDNDPTPVGRSEWWTEIKVEEEARSLKIWCREHIRKQMRWQGRWFGAWAVPHEAVFVELFGADRAKLRSYKPMKLSLLEFDAVIGYIRVRLGDKHSLFVTSANVVWMSGVNMFMLFGTFGLDTGPDY
ncbi:uncharacterized protein K452DRAFT_297334 [Aplosporella prunicola CBS 121167]|uniref:Uncharacterized protein n=1 Tax=Aplosporella prunicola CBS 121167 TaxID=1176127 RepID=A0A6A6BJQ6_9PEZI|nr:uncharacterized protein K452DRAFT_297334 [Aplosporella prunicola CBS 121167]KAF2142801.1 hypothetical protein K452DRAFT_297334 [Aplosporella prunicola CBS 121167]